MTSEPGHQAGPSLRITDPDRPPLAIDTIRALFTYTLALLVVVGGGGMLFVSRAEPADDLRIMLAGFIGSALTFAFGQEVQTRTARQAASATAANQAATVAQTAAANSGVGEPAARNGG